jgi:hypothetical protein
MDTLARVAAMLIAGSLPVMGNASCGAAFCLVNTNWGAQGVWTEPGWRADLRYEYIDQDQPRTGTRDINVGEISRHHDEVRTLNRNLFATLDYGFSPDWGASLIIPWIDRSHEHIHNHHGAAIRDFWKFSDVGDIRVTARYQRVLEAPNALTLSYVGLIGGLKLPTGKTDVTNGEGAVAERTLQPGTGTTDAVLGVYFRRRWRALGSDRPAGSAAATQCSMEGT